MGSRFLRRWSATGSCDRLAAERDTVCALLAAYPQGEVGLAESLRRRQAVTGGAAVPIAPPRSLWQAYLHLPGHLACGQPFT